MKDTAIVITSCDKRAELWPIQFKELFKYWPSLNRDKAFIPIYLIANFKIYEGQRVTTIAVGKDISWSDNLILALKKIDKPFIIMLLDDYIPTTFINEKRLVELLNLTQINHAPHTEISMDPVLFDGIPHKNVQDLMYRAQKGSARTSLQAAIWNKEALLSLLKAGENPWQFEKFSNERSFWYLKPFYIVTGQPVIQYVNLTASDEKNLNGKRVSRYDQKSIQHLTDTGISNLPSKSLIVNVIK